MIQKLEEWAAAHNYQYTFEEDDYCWWMGFYPAKDALEFDPEIMISFQRDEYLLFIRWKTGLLSWQQIDEWPEKDCKFEDVTLRLAEIISQAKEVPRP